LNPIIRTSSNYFLFLSNLDCKDKFVWGNFTRTWTYFFDFFFHSI